MEVRRRNESAIKGIYEGFSFNIQNFMQEEREEEEKKINFLSIFLVHHAIIWLTSMRE
jgi:hypothetical protein